MTLAKIDDKAISDYITPELAVLGAALRGFNLNKTLKILILLQVVLEAEVRERTKGQFV